MYAGMIRGFIVDTMARALIQAQNACALINAVNSEAGESILGPGNLGPAESKAIMARIFAASREMSAAVKAAEDDAARQMEERVRQRTGKEVPLASVIDELDRISAGKGSVNG